MRKRFLYFLPGLSGCNPRMLADRGLLSRFVGTGGALMEHTISACDNGPAGGGCIIALGPRPSEYKPESQGWVDCGKFWLAIESKELVPGPADLVREIGIDGYELVLNDRQQWRVPLLRRWNAADCSHVSALPKSMRPVNGRIREVVMPAYQAYDDMAEATWQSFVKQERVQLEELFSRASALLGINYRLETEEVGVLGLFDADLAMRVLTTSIDLPSIEEHRERVALDGLMSNTPASEEDALHG